MSIIKSAIHPVKPSFIRPTGNFYYNAVMPIVVALVKVQLSYSILAVHVPASSAFLPLMVSSRANDF